MSRDFDDDGRCIYCGSNAQTRLDAAEIRTKELEAEVEMLRADRRIICKDHTDSVAEVARLRAALERAKEALEHSIKWTAENSLLWKDHQGAIADICAALAGEKER